MNDNRNMIMAIVLSVIVLVGWQYFFGIPQMEKQRAAQQAQQAQTAAPAAQGGSQPAPAAGSPAPSTAAGIAPGQVVASAASREAALAASPRALINTPRLKGSINLKGGRIDDVQLVNYHQTVDKSSPNIVLLSPEGTPVDVKNAQHPFYAEFGWVPAQGVSIAVPNAQTLWQAEGNATLSPETPVVLTHDNGQGFLFRRTYSVDKDFMITVSDAVENKSGNSIVLHPYALISRHGTPKTEGFYILHEGLIGVSGDKTLHEIKYADIEKTRTETVKTEAGWLGITDKYWAAALVPDQSGPKDFRFVAGQSGGLKTYQTDIIREGVTIAPQGSAQSSIRLFAGAKEVKTIDDYAKQGIKRFDLMIDWGWFYFITKPMFYMLDWIFKLFGNFGVAILLLTLVIKGLFFPLANKSYASMTKMKKVQPEMMAIRDRFADDKMKQQQEMMALYKREQINPLAGCWPILIQIPVFFSLYKVLFITIEMRHAPFFGWIRDLSAPDPTNIFNLFGLLPFDPSTLPVLGSFLHLGIWPVIMGITMWVQMQMNPAPTDQMQAAMFKWMPLIFTFMLAAFPAGLVIYWSWNNLLSVLQQGYIMKKYGVKIELWDNLKAAFGRKPATPTQS